MYCSNIYFWPWFLTLDYRNPCKLLSDKSMSNNFCSSEVQRLLDGIWSPEIPSHLKRVGILALLPSSREVRETRIEVSNRSCICKEASIKSQQCGVQRASVLANASTPGGWSMLTQEGQKRQCLGPSQNSLCVSVHQTVCLYPLSYSSINC